MFHDAMPVNYIVFGMIFRVIDTAKKKCVNNFGQHFFDSLQLFTLIDGGFVLELVLLAALAAMAVCAVAFYALVVLNGSIHRSIPWWASFYWNWMGKTTKTHTKIDWLSHNSHAAKLKLPIFFKMSAPITSSCHWWNDFVTKLLRLHWSCTFEIDTNVFFSGLNTAPIGSLQRLNKQATERWMFDRTQNVIGYYGDFPTVLVRLMK